MITIIPGWHGKHEAFNISLVRSEPFQSMVCEANHVLLEVDLDVPGLSATAHGRRCEEGLW